MKKKTARQKRDEVLDLFEETRAAWLARARIAATRLARERGSITIDDVRAVEPPPAGCDPRCMGAVMRAPLFERVGYTNSERGHGRAIAVFRLASSPTAHSALL